MSRDCCVALPRDAMGLSTIFGLKTLLQQGILEPIFHEDLVYKSKGLLENLILVINSKSLPNVIHV